MGKMAMQLNRIFDNALRAKIISLEEFIKAKQQAEQNLPRLPSAEQLIADGGDHNACALRKHSQPDCSIW